MNVTVAKTDNNGRMSGPQFRAFQAVRPDHERWELIAGVPFMMTPPTLAHGRIAGNLERLLNDALARHDPSRIANQRPGIDLGSSDFKPEPDVAVIDAEYEAGQRFAERAWLLAEVVSATDNIVVPGTSESWVEVKRRIYLDHQHCQAVLFIEQDRVEVRIDTRADAGWRSVTLFAPQAEVALPVFGFRCLVADLYRGTPLLRATATALNV